MKIYSYYSFIIAFGLLTIQVSAADVQASVPCKFEGYSGGYFLISNERIPCFSSNCSLLMGAKKVKEKIEALRCTPVAESCPIVFRSPYVSLPARGDYALYERPQAFTVPVVGLRIGTAYTFTEIGTSALVRYSGWGIAGLKTPESYYPALSRGRPYRIDFDVNPYIYGTDFLYKPVDKNLDELQVALKEAVEARNVFVEAGLCANPLQPTKCSFGPPKKSFSGCLPKRIDLPSECLTVDLREISGSSEVEGVLASHDHTKVLTFLNGLGFCK